METDAEVRVVSYGKDWEKLLSVQQCSRLKMTGWFIPLFSHP